jgi:hypothetical protein
LGESLAHSWSDHPSYVNGLDKSRECGEGAANITPQHCEALDIEMHPTWNATTIHALPIEALTGLPWGPETARCGEALLGTSASTSLTRIHPLFHRLYFYPTVAVYISFILRFRILMMAQIRRWAEEDSIKSTESTPSLDRQPRNTFENRAHVLNQVGQQNVYGDVVFQSV